MKTKLLRRFRKRFIISKAPNRPDEWYILFDKKRNETTYRVGYWYFRDVSSAIIIGIERLVDKRTLNKFIDNRERIDLIKSLKQLK